MKYQVIVQPNALFEATESALWWAENRSEEQAARWYENFHRVMRKLSDNPQRHSYARENNEFPYILRQLLFGIGRKPIHRAISHIKDDTVYVLSVRHVAQRNISPDDF